MRRIAWEVVGCVGLAIGVMLIGGCGAEDKAWPPIKREDMGKVKPGMALSEIEAILGPSHAASSDQTKKLDEAFPQIPEQIRKSLEAGSTDLAWGASDAWVAARVSADKKAWLVSSQTGGGGGPMPPAPPGKEAPKVYFRDPNPNPPALDDAGQLMAIGVVTAHQQNSRRSRAGCFVMRAAVALRSAKEIAFRGWR